MVNTSRHIILVTAVFITGCRTDTAFVNALDAAHRERRPPPLVTHVFPALSTPAAYRIQQRYIRRRLRNDDIAGFKAGLTSPAAQRQFGVRQPVAGVLFESGRRTRGETLNWPCTSTRLVEAEFAFIVGLAIREPIRSIAELKRHIVAVAPAIELPNVGFAADRPPKGVDIIATNVGADQYIIGDPISVDQLGVEPVPVTVYHNASAISHSHAQNGNNEQWMALLWLANTQVTNGWEIGTGDVLLTGALGRPLLAESGHYVADFGTLGEIHVVIKTTCTD